MSGDVFVFCLAPLDECQVMSLCSSSSIVPVFHCRSFGWMSGDVPVFFHCSCVAGPLGGCRVMSLCSSSSIVPALRCRSCGWMSGDVPLFFFHCSCVALQVLWDPPLGSLLPRLHAVSGPRKPGSDAVCDDRRTARPATELPTSHVGGFGGWGGREGGREGREGGAGGRGGNHGIENRGNNWGFSAQMVDNTPKLLNSLNLLSTVALDKTG